jgi:transposase InsO family protein
MLRSDHGPEFRNLRRKELLALAGLRHRLGAPWRPTEQSGVERIHQEMQKMLGIILLDILQAVPSYWSEALPVVEFVIYNTPGPHKFTPRDTDHRWSVASPLEQELIPFEILGHEPMTEYVQMIVADYRQVRETILEHYQQSSETGQAC